MDAPRDRRWTIVHVHTSLWILLGLVWIGSFAIAQADLSQQELKTHVTEDGLHFSAMSDGPFLITHLVAYGDGESEKRSAVLPEPIVSLDSSGASLSRAQIGRLVWHQNVPNEKTQPPEIADISAVYTRVLIARHPDYTR